MGILEDKNILGNENDDHITEIVVYVPGLGAGIAYLPAQVIIQQHFQGLKSRAVAMGLASAGLSLGVMAFSPLTRFLIDWYGWRGAILIISGCSLQILIPAAMFRPPKTKSPNTEWSPEAEDEDDTPDNDLGSHGNRVTRCCTLICDGFKSYFDPALADVRFVLLLCGCFTIMFGLDTIYIRSAARAESVGIDPVKASLVITISSPFAALGRIMGGFIARCIQPRNMFGSGLVSGGTAIIVSGLFAQDKFELHALFCAWFALSLGKYILGIFYM